MLINSVPLFQGAQQKSLAARKQRAEKVEEERRMIDVEEAEFQAADRRVAIDKAKTQLYYETDRVKAFHVRSPRVLWNTRWKLDLFRLFFARSPIARMYQIVLKLNSGKFEIFSYFINW